eukprot:gene5237-8848_t
MFSDKDSFDLLEITEEFPTIRNEFLQEEGIDLFFLTLLQAENRNEIIHSITKKLLLEEILILFQKLTKENSSKTRETMKIFLHSISTEQLQQFYSEVCFMNITLNIKQFFNTLNSFKLHQKISFEKMISTNEKKRKQIDFSSIFYLITESNDNEEIITNLIYYLNSLKEENSKTVLGDFCKQISMNKEFLEKLEEFFKKNKNEKFVKKLLNICKYQIQHLSEDDFLLKLKMDLLQVKIQNLSSDGNSISKISHTLQQKNMKELSKISFEDMADYIKFRDPSFNSINSIELSLSKDLVPLFEIMFNSNDPQKKEFMKEARIQFILNSTTIRMQTL